MATSILCGLTAFVIVAILFQPLEIFGWWPPLLRKILFGSTAIVGFEDMKWWQLSIYKPFAGCAVCFSGWVGMAYFFFGNHQIEKGFFTFVFFECLTILTAWGLSQIKEAIKN